MAPSRGIAIFFGGQAMTVTLGKYKRGGLEVRIHLTDAAGNRIYRRLKSPVDSSSGSLKWGKARERELLEVILRGEPPDATTAEVAPTLNEFAPQFLASCVADRHKPSGIADKESRLKNHLLPALGEKRLNEISNEDVQKLKHRLRDKAASTVNNTLSVLRKLLSVAVELGVLREIPCKIRHLRRQESEAKFWDFGDLERLASSSAQVDWRAEVIVLLGGHAGLRLGEMCGLKWSDLDLGRQRMCVQRAEWRGQIVAPKGGRKRTVPLTARLVSALTQHRHLGDWVLCREDGSRLSSKMAQTLVERSEHRAGLPHLGVHALRHTFCSHLAMRGAPPRSVQELAGHANITTTMGYMHLSPRALREAIDLLDKRVETRAEAQVLENPSDWGATT